MQTGVKSRSRTREIAIGGKIAIAIVRTESNHVFTIRTAIGRIQPHRLAR